MSGNLWADTMVPVQGMGLSFTVGLPLVGLTESAVMNVASTTLTGDMQQLAIDLTGGDAISGGGAMPVRPAMPPPPPVPPVMPAGLVAAMKAWLA